MADTPTQLPTADPLEPSTFQAIAQLTDDVWWQARIRACAVQQSETFVNDARPQFVAAAGEVLRGGSDITLALTRIAGAGPGMADTAGNPPDQAQIPDADILASVQANFPLVAGLYYSEDGSPI
jgi:hypothetical protein